MTPTATTWQAHSTIWWRRGAADADSWRARTRVTKGAGSRRRGLVMAYKLLDAAQHRWRKVNSPEFVALVRDGKLYNSRDRLGEDHDNNLDVLGIASSYD